jgi:hypothetical protein
MHIDPKDQPAHKDWYPTFRAAWDERRKLRLEHLDLTNRIEQLDQFIDLFMKFEDPDLKRRQAEWDAMYGGDGGMGQLSISGVKIPPRPTWRDAVNGTASDA